MIGLEKFNKVLQKDNVKYTVVGLIALHILLLSYIPTNIIHLYTDIEGRIVVAIIVAYLAYVSPVIAIALTIAYMVVLRENDIRNNNKLFGVQNADIVNYKNNQDSLQATMNDVNKVVSQYAGQAKGSVQSVFDNTTKPENNDMTPPESMGHPADKTLTDNIQLESPEFRQLEAIQQNNLETGNGVMSAFGTVLDAQGSTFVRGFDAKTYKYSRA